MPFLLVISGTASAATGLLGKPCKKVGQKIVSAGTNLTCVAKGKQLVWAKAPIVPAIPALSILPKFTTSLNVDGLNVTVFGVDKSAIVKNRLKYFFVEFSLDRESLNARATKSVYDTDGSPLKSWIFEASGLSVAAGHMLGVIVGFINEDGKASRSPESYLAIPSIAPTPMPTQLSCAFVRVAPPPCESSV